MYGHQKPTVCLMQDIPCDSFLDGLCRTRAPLSPNSETINLIHPRAAASRELYHRITRISVSALIETHLILLHR